MIINLVLLGATFLAALIDVRTRRIPNALTGTLAVLAIALHVPLGFAATATAIAAMVVFFAIGMLAFRLGWFGGGDVKLLAGCCGVVSFPNCVVLIAFVLAAGAVVALVCAAIDRRLIALLHSSMAVAAGHGEAEQRSLPYAVAIAGGSVCYIALTLSTASRIS